MKLTSFAFIATQSRLFRYAAQQQGQAGLARARKPEFFPAHIIPDLPETVTHLPQSFEDLLKQSGAATLQEIPKPVLENTSTEAVVEPMAVPAYFRDSKFDRVPYWQKIGRWKGITEKQFLSYSWGVSQMHSHTKSKRHMLIPSRLQMIFKASKSSTTSSSKPYQRESPKARSINTSAPAMTLSWMSCMVSTKPRCQFAFLLTSSAPLTGPILSETLFVASSFPCCQHSSLITRR
jgi:hypothetical protein